MHSSGQSPLLAAVGGGFDEIVVMLLKMKADANQRIGNFTPLLLVLFRRLVRINQVIVLVTIVFVNVAAGILHGFQSTN